MATALAAARYGKDKIRVFRVVRDGKWHSVVEYNVTVLVEGDIGTRCVLGFTGLRSCSLSVATLKRTTLWWSLRILVGH